MAYPLTSEAIVEGTGLAPGQIDLTDTVETVSVQCPTAISSSYTFRMPPALGAIGTVFAMLNSTDTSWITASAGSKAIWVLTDEKTSGTGGGTLTVNTWTTRDLNTIVQSPSAGTDVQLAVSPAGTNQILVQPGTYIVMGYSPTRTAQIYKTALWDDDTGTIVITGTSEQSRFILSSDSCIFDIITIAIQTVMSVKVYVTNVSSADPLGTAVGIPSVPEIYTRLSLYKL